LKGFKPRTSRGYLNGKPSVPLWAGGANAATESNHRLWCGFTTFISLHGIFEGWMFSAYFIDIVFGLSKKNAPFVETDIFSMTKNAS
jgi:hypothetical protein